MTHVRIHVLRVLIGCLLLVAAASKLPAFPPFAGVIRSLTDIGGAAAAAVAAIVIGAETTVGVFLLIPRRTRAASVAAFALFLCFAMVLTAAVMRGIDLPCMCFGFLAPRLPLRAEAVIDILLCLGALECAREAAHGPLTASRIRAGLPIACGLAWASLLIAWPGTGNAARAGVPAAGDFFAGASPLRGDYPAVTLIADFNDFACQLCLDDFLAFCDSLNQFAARRVPHIRLVARRDFSRTYAEQARMLEGWASGNGYRFPVAVDTDSLFERTSAQKTSAIVWGSDGRLVDFARFPLGPSRRNDLLRALTE